MHSEISPRDLPPDHPGRKAAEAQSGGVGGTTSGDAEGGAGGRFTRDGDAGDRPPQGDRPGQRHPA